MVWRKMALPITLYPFFVGVKQLVSARESDSSIKKFITVENLFATLKHISYESKRKN